MSSSPEVFLSRAMNGTVAEVIIGSTYIALSTIFIVTSAMVDWIAGGILNASWITMAGLILALALNQLSVISYGIGKLQNNYFSRFTSATTVHIFVAYGVGIIFFVVFMTPWSGVIYLREAFCFTYDNEMDANETISQIDWLYTITIISLSFIAYLLIFILVIKKRRIYNMEFNKTELRILFHSVVMYCWVLFIIFTFHNYAMFLPPSEWTFFALSVSWILYCGVTPILNIAFNRTIRKKFVNKYFRCEAKSCMVACEMAITNISGKRKNLAVQHH